MKNQNHLWHPNTQMSEWNKFPKIVRGEGMWVIDEDGNRLLDGVASMWCNVWGHSKKELVNAIIKQTKKLQHAPLFNLTNEPSESLAKKLVNGTIDLESTAKKFELDLKHTPFFNRSDSIPGIGNLEKLKTKAFELNNGKTGWVLVRNNYYLIRLQERQKADAPDMETLKELRKKLKLEKGDSAFQEWMKNLKESSEILVDKSQI